MLQNISTLDVGARCLAALDGYWNPGRILRVNEDGTYTIEFDNDKSILLRHWFGVTSDEISIDDELHWPTLFSSLTDNSSTMIPSIFASVLEDAGYRINEEQFYKFWCEQCKELFGIDDATDVGLSQDRAYQLLVRAGCSAKRLIHRDRTEIVYYKLYWNETRMAGRQPSEIGRPVTLDDAFDALGIRQPKSDAASVSRVEKFQHDNNVELPSNLYRFLCCSGISKAVFESHPNNPELVLPDDEDEYFVFQSNPPLTTAIADYALTIMIPHQGNHVWVAVFNRGDSDATVYVTTWDADDWILTAPTIGMFFWDLAQTGLIWYQGTGFNGGKPIEKTDIGVIPKNAE